MAVRQYTVFIGQDARANVLDPSYFGVWTSDGTTATEVLALNNPPGFGGLSAISGAADLPGSLVFAVGRDPAGVLFATDAVLRSFVERQQP